MLEQLLPNEILIVEASTIHSLPAGMLLQSMVIPSNAVDVKLIVLVQNELLKDVAILVGTLVGHLCITDVVMTVSDPQQGSEEFDANLINSGESLVPEEWETRLCQKLSERATVFSLHELDVGLAKGVEHTIHLSDP